MMMLMNKIDFPHSLLLLLLLLLLRLLLQLQLEPAHL